jgi:cytochrome o ubiquinol oxidase subunit 3
MQEKVLSQDVPKTLLGLWIYLTTDWILFGALIATYFVLGPVPTSLIDSTRLLRESLALLLAQGCASLILSCLKKGKVGTSYPCLMALVAIAIWFFLEQRGDLQSFKAHGYTYHSDGASSAYWTLMGTHTLHVGVALLWTLFLGARLTYKKVNDVAMRRWRCLQMFWQFIYFIWLFVLGALYGA